MPPKIKKKVNNVINAIQYIGFPKAFNTIYIGSAKGYSKLNEIKVGFSNREERIVYFQLIHNKYYLLYGYTKQKPQEADIADKKAARIAKEVIRRYNNGTL